MTDPADARRPLAPEDEAEHPPVDEPHWSESWYFDAVAPDGSLGVYVRLGRVPGRDAAHYAAAVVRPGEPPILLVAPDAPLPGDARQTLATDDFRASQECVEPLRRFRVTVAGTGQAYDEQHGPLHGGSSTPVEVDLDLTWDTDGTPYRWTFADRYEIPCRVRGTVRIDGAELALDGPDQRDHSWGARDWWSSEWVWSAFHLEDGTRLHAVTIPAVPGLAIGYVQRDGELVELTAGSGRHEADADGLVGTTVLTLEDAGLSVEAQPVAFAPLRMESDEGKVSFFPRALATVRTDDGRTGLGWIEWNHVQG